MWQPNPWTRGAFGLPWASRGHSTWANEKDMLKRCFANSAPSCDLA